ncbi:hypothetical protein FH968_18010 [Buttiauxella sp. B2]|uniref:YciI family protein n=1 Tax=Buttiauxella sp. B2 TaxID=2587812 RepID=UPI0011217BA9|nr:YciI family protein [Buttiauxella sp. B2]TNV17946.1 hypothetical protein FH968_18010 [Buttiauxella sp. B2]
MLFMLRFYDKPDCLSLRQRWLPAHLDWLARHQSVIKIAGSLRTEDCDTPDGACWLVEVDSFAEAHVCYLQDPFWREGLRERVELHSLSKAFDNPVTL